MSRAVIRRVALMVSLVAVLGGTVAGQSTQKKPARKRPPTTEPSAPEPAPKPAATTDVKIRTRYTSGALVSENTTYLKGTRQRVEFPGAVSIEQCDLGRTLLINPVSKTYLVTEHGAGAAASGAPADPRQIGTAGQSAPATSKGGVVTVVTTLADTGERKEMFGREARHITTTVTKQASASACDKDSSTVEVDGWYVDLPVGAQCPTSQAAPRPASSGCVDRLESTTTGDAKLGFPLLTKTTTTSGEADKQETAVSSMEVTSLDVTPLDAALFEAPAGYSQAPGSGQMMAGFESSGGINDALLGSTADGTGSAAPKATGRVRIGVLQPIDKSSHKLPTRALRQQLAGEFGKAPFEAVTLAGGSAADAQADAARMQCDYVLYTEIAEIKTSKPGRMGSMLKKVSRDGPPRDTHEVTLDYKLYPVGAAAPTVSERTTASSGGGFNIHSAVHMAMFAGSMYLRFSGLGMFNPMLSNFGGLGVLPSRGLFDPRMNAMSSWAQLFSGNGTGATGTSGAGENDEDAIRQTVDGALTSEAKGAIERLRTVKKQ